MRHSGAARAAALFCAGAASVSVVAGCGGGSHFKNNPRPAEPLQLTGVVTPTGVTVSPNHIGGGPIVLDISNQTQQSHTIMLERVGNAGEPHRDIIGPINPLQASPLQQTLTPGQYTVSVGPDASSIPPAVITVGVGGVCAGGASARPDGHCPNSSSTTLLP